MQTDPRNESAWLWLASASDDVDRRRDCLLRVLAINSKNETAWLRMALTVDDPARKRECYKRVLAIDPNNSMARAHLRLLGQEPSTTTRRDHAGSLNGAPSPAISEVGAERAGHADPGWVYIMINPSMPGLVKVGKTQRDPEERARELSSATGVPTPFIVAYQARFADCTQAEAYVHSVLEQQGLRVGEDREFFGAPTHVAVEMVFQATRIYGQMAGREGVGPQLAEADACGPGITSLADQEPWRSVYEQAEAHLYGIGDTLEDEDEALRLYKQAARLGCTVAHWSIGRMYADGEGCRKDTKRAHKHFRDGIKAGDERCWAELALLFGEEGHLENSDKCWRNYFESTAFSDNAAQDAVFNRPYYGLRYLQSAIYKKQRITFQEYLMPISEEILERCDRFIQSF